MAKAIEEVVRAIVDELRQPGYCDSPVRQAGKLVTYARDFVEQLQSENMNLKAQRGEDLFTAAIATEEPSERLRLLREASRINPSRSDALVELGAELRKQAQFDESVSVLKRATTLDSKCAEAFRELGIVYGRLKKLELAVNALEEAVRLSPEYSEALRNLGGALRRWGMRDAPNNIDWNAIRQARDRYAAASNKEPHDTYSLLNVAKLELLLSKNDPSRLPAAMGQFGKVKPLCQFNVSDKPDDPWRRFDLAEAHLFSGEFKEGHDLYKEAIKTVAVSHRQSYLTSVLSPLTELLTLDVVSGDLQKAVRKVSTLLEKEIAAAK